MSNINKPEDLIRNIKDNCGKLIWQVISKPFHISEFTIRKHDKKGLNYYTFCISIVKFIICIMFTAAILLISDTEIFKQNYTENILAISNYSLTTFLSVFGGCMTAFSIFIAFINKAAILKIRIIFVYIPVINIYCSLLFAVFIFININILLELCAFLLNLYLTIMIIIYSKITEN